MKLLKLTLHGEYKGLKDQTFDFTGCDGEVVALIGLNGSGKSHLLELICETFAWLERYERKDFRTRKPLPFSVDLEYTLKFQAEEEIELHVSALISDEGRLTAVSRNQENGIEEDFLPLPQNIVGYSSGLNENLQRSFMKNSLQYYDVMSIRAARRRRINLELDELDLLEANRYYLKRYPGIFSRSSFETDETEAFQDLQENPTNAPMMKFLDYDSANLLLASISILEKEVIQTLFREVDFNLPESFEIEYDLRHTNFEEEAIRDIRQLIRIVGDWNLIPLSPKTSDKDFDAYGLEFFSARIPIKLSNPILKNSLSNAYYGTPSTLFEKLFKIQLLGIRHWQTSDKKALRDDSFSGNVKKALKTKLPLSIRNLKLANRNGETVEWDDLSDGESQILQTLSAAYIFNHEETLYIFDEPETHLNPTWRTHFHQSLVSALSIKAERRPAENQAFVSTHSPFMVSALHRDNVLHFKKSEEGPIEMFPAEYQTYGAAFGVLIKQYFGVKSLISQTAIDEIKRHLDSPTPETLSWIEQNLGDSPEKAYLLRKLST